MKSLLLTTLFVGISAFATLPAYAQADNNEILQTNSLDALIDILNNASADTPSDELKKELADLIEELCKNTSPIDLYSPIANRTCSPEQLDLIMNEAIAAIGLDNPYISDFLSALVLSGVDSDAVTLAAITAGVDATVASEATAAGPGGDPTSPTPVIFTLPTSTVPPGAGGTGGDAGISEVGN
ncbi:hypothetical protein [Pseudoalteromonas sp. Z9A4]|jgi:hypothetical protein|uniref:hypothetical protein n=1 Tax=Pseudoalteromonas sp. Z9A4 TaxID=2686353 RepID=UPI00140B9D80|nr:hypothetical protein [Pseudoalteromonas sp. Z9A4]